VGVAERGARSVHLVRTRSAHRLQDRPDHRTLAMWTARRHWRWTRFKLGMHVECRLPASSAQHW